MRGFLFCSVLLLIASITSPRLAAQDKSAVGKWNGAINTPGSPLAITVVLSLNGEALEGTIDIPAQNSHGLQLGNVAQRGDSVLFVINSIPGNPTFKGRFAGDDRITGAFLQGGAELSFSLERESAKGLAEQESARAATLDSLRAFINATASEWDVPGVSVAIVQGDSVVMAEGFGVRSIAGEQRVTEQTLFAIGSSTKAFTSTVIGSLVDDGQLDWDQPVLDYLPTFRLHDDYATRTIRVKDLLTHVSGLPRHDLMWYGSSLSRKELFDHLRYLAPTAALYTRWQYQNLMFMTAGYLAGQVANASWEELVEKRILGPLGMVSTNLSVAALSSAPDRATGYTETVTGTLDSLPYRDLSQIGPAGSINSNAADMARWVRFNLGDGTAGTERVLNESTLEAIHRARIVVSDRTANEPEIIFNLYGMGWFVTSFRGHRLVYHGGNIDGFSALVGFLPDDGIGVAILTNMNSTQLPEVLAYTVFDRLLGAPARDWSTPALAQKASLVTAITESVEQAISIERVPDTRPSHRVEDYVGEYIDSAYGLVTISEVGDRLVFNYNSFSGKLGHFHYDVFQVDDENSLMAGTKLQFVTDISGNIDAVRILLEPMVPPIEFHRRPDAALSDTLTLALYTGRYTLAGAEITVKLEDGALVMNVPSQPTYTLEPYRPYEFKVKGLAGYSVRFIEKNGSIESMAFLQPNGTFVAERVE